MPKITKRAVDAAAPKSARYYVWDDELKGFGLQILPTGVKSYVYQYRTPEGRSRRGTLGKHGTLTPDQAREKAKRWQGLLESNIDPLGKKQADREAPTVKKVLELYLESAKFAEKAESTRSIDRGRIERHLIPLLGKKYAHELTAEDVRRAFAAIRDGKTATDVKTRARGRAIVKGGEGTARMAIRLFRAVLEWAVSEGLASSNPATNVKVGSDGNRDVILDSPAQYEALFRTLDRMENEKRIRRATADAIRVIALTGARRGEIAGLRWRYVDQAGSRIVLPPTQHKTGRKTGKPRIIGMPAAAAAIIARQPEGTPDEYVFKPAKGEGMISLSKPWREVRADAQLPEAIGLHGLRHSLASWMAMQGAEAAEIMTALGHRQLSTAQRYVHWAQDARAVLAEKAAAHVVAAMNPETPTADVVPLPKKKPGRQG